MNCPQCGNKRISVKGEYCIFCGHKWADEDLFEGFDIPQELRDVFNPNKGEQK